MKKLIYLILVAVIIASCGSEDNKENETSYEEKATNAIKEYTHAKEIKNVKLINEVSNEDAVKKLNTLKEALTLYNEGVSGNQKAIESYEQAKEAMSQIDVETYGEMLGISKVTNYDSLIEDINNRIDIANTQISETEFLISSLESAINKSEGKSPYTLFEADVDGVKRIFALYPDGRQEVDVYFESTESTESK